MPLISQKTINEIENRLDPVRIVGEYVRLEQRGGNYWGLCPFHNEKTPSFTVNSERKSYYCFGCHEGGGIIHFVMQMEKIPFPEALTLLAKKCNIPIEYEAGNGQDTGPNEDQSQKKDELAELYRRVAGSFHHILTQTEEGAPAKNYLHSRGISGEMISAFRLGYAPAERSWLYHFLTAKGYSAAFLAQSALFSKNYPQKAFFSNRLMFPINDRQGRTVAFGARLLAGDGPKYLNSQETLLYHKRETLFAIDRALPAIRTSKEVIICEGYMDVIALHQAGVANAVAPLGTAFTADQARLLRRWADRVNLLFDNDEAGQNACDKAVLVCRANALACAVIQTAGTPEQTFKDPADILKDGGIDLLRNSVKNVILDADFLITKSKGRFLLPGNGIEGVSKAVAFLRTFWAALESETEKEAFYKKIALAFNVEPKTVLHDLQSGNDKKAELRQRSGVELAARQVRMNEELYVVTAVAVNCESNPDLLNVLRKQLPCEEFEDRDAKELYLALEECLRAGAVTFDALLARLEDQALRAFVMRKNAEQEFSSRIEAVVTSGIRGVRVKHLETKSRKLDIQIRLAKNQGRDTNDLLLEKQCVLDALRELKQSGTS